MPFPISLSNEFSGNVLSRLNESSSSLCFNFIVRILVCTFYDCQIGFNKNFPYKESFAASEVKAFRKARDPANKKKSIFVSESLSPACNLFLPQLSKRCWRPHMERITWNSRKLRWGYFCSKLLFAWRDVYRWECQFASLFMLTQSCFTFCVPTFNFTCCKLHVSFCRFSVFILTACDTWSKFRDMASLTLLSYVGLRVQYQSLCERA